MTDQASSPLLTPARLRLLVRGIEKPGGVETCWLWRGAVNPSGYGVFLSVPAYRLAYEWMVGPIPAGMELDHLCREKLCVNPHHLEPVTRLDNMRRRYQPFGEFSIREYCRFGHALVGDNVRRVRNGGGVVREMCWACTRQRAERRKLRRHAS